MKGQNVIHVDMDGVLCDFETPFAEKKTKDLPYPQSVDGFWEELKPIEGAIESFKHLYNDPFWDVYILSSPSVYNPVSYSGKRNWIEKHLGFDVLYKTILTPSKDMCWGNYLIDDMDSGRGQELFKGKLIHFGSEEFPSWAEVRKYFDMIE